MPNPSMKQCDPQGPSATPASKFTHCAPFHPLMSSCRVLPVIPTVLAMLLAVPIGKTAIGVRLPISRLATLPTVPSPPATATMSQFFLSAFFHFLSFDD